MNRPLPFKALFLAALLALLVPVAAMVGCGKEPVPTSTPTKTPTSAPSVTPTPSPRVVSQVLPTATKAPTATAAQTATPTLTATQTPTATPSPTPEEPTETPFRKGGSTRTPPHKGNPIGTPALASVKPTTAPDSAVSTATSTPIPSGATAINPLTGLAVPANRLNRRPLGIKIPNFPFEARPQSGLSFADVVIEHEAEAYLTRFTAIFLGNDVNSEVGPVRSVRLVDGELMSIFKSTLVTSGGHPAVKIRVTEGKSWAAGYKRIICPEAPFLGDGGTLQRVPKAGRRYELTLYSNTARLWNLSTQRGINQKQDFGGMWTFSEAPPEGGRDATYLKIVYKPTWSIAEYRYDAGSKTYKRFDVGQPSTDALTGRQIAPPNVVVLYVNHVNSDIAADTHDPNNIYYSVVHQIWGEGTGKLMRDGKVYDIRWIRENPQQADDRLVFLDATGSKIPLRPGPTWIQLVRPDAEMQIN